MVSLSIRRLLGVCVLTLIAAARVEAAAVTLAWDVAPDPTVTGYLLSYGLTPGTYDHTIDVGNKTRFTILSIPAGTYYFAVQAYSTVGVSAYSAEVTGTVVNPPKPATLAPDFDGDRKSDLAIWRASTGTWYLADSTSSFTDGLSQQWGNQSMGDVPLSGDIDGDGIGDLVVWRASTGTWFWLRSADNYDSSTAGSVQFGNSSLGDQPFLGDVDGDGRADLIVWRASNGTWYWLTSSTNYSYAGARSLQFGNNGFGDKPFIADIDGDSKADFLVWRRSNGTWFWLTSSTGYSYSVGGSAQWGNQALGDLPLIGDLDGDGKTDLVIWRATTGTWYWLNSSKRYAYSGAGSMQWGNQALGDTPLLMDLDGDQRADLTVWRSSNGTWYWLSSSGGFSYATARSRQFGNSSLGDVPIVR